MAEPVLFADIEAWICTWLRDQLAERPEPYARGVHVAIAVPNPRGERMVIVRRDGGPRLDVVRESVRLGFQVWAPTDEDTADLAQLVRGLMAATVGEGPVRRASETAGPVAVADPSGRPLRYFTVELICRAIRPAEKHRSAPNHSQMPGRWGLVAPGLPLPDYRGRPGT